ncbi:MAG: hypothetical protein HGA44_08650, partial [Cellulomonadaceae bacterium]|nr:hypothetical protein [Cellulomonadaceae bacterium]
MTAAERREERRARRVLRRMDRSARRHASGASGAGGAGWVAVAVLAVVVGLAAHERGWAPTDLADLVHPRVFVEIEGRAVAVPRPEESTGRVLPAVAVTTSGSHAFLHTTEAGAPVGYDPCRPVRYVVASHGVPASGQQLVADAVAIVSAASGLALVDAGTTEELPVLDRALIQEDRYGPGWAPVLIAWADETTVPELAGQVAG